MIIWQFFVSWEVFARWRSQLSTSSENQKEKEVFFQSSKNYVPVFATSDLDLNCHRTEKKIPNFFCHGDNFGLEILNPVTNAINVLQARIYKSVKQAYF